MLLSTSGSVAISISPFLSSLSVIARSTVELFVTLEGEDEPFVTKRTEDLNFKVEFDGLNQLCKSYIIGIRLIGTEGTSMLVQCLSKA